MQTLKLLRFAVVLARSCFWAVRLLNSNISVSVIESRSAVSIAAPAPVHSPLGQDNGKLDRPAKITIAKPVNSTDKHLFRPGLFEN